MKLGIIIPTKNEEENLPFLLNSIKKQSFKNYKIIIADDSEDGTKKIARDYGCVIVQGGLPSVARDSGVKKANELGIKNFLFLDADTILRGNSFLELSLEEIKKRKLDVSTVLVVPFNLKNRFKKSNDFRYLALYGVANIFIRIFEKTKKPLMQNCMFSRMEVHKKIGGFGKIEYSEDSEYAKKSVKMGYHFGILKTPKKVLLSPRRLKKEGFLKMLLLFIYLHFKIFMGKKFYIKTEKVYFK